MFFIRAAVSGSKKETTMRRKDLSGVQVWIEAEELMTSLIFCRLSAVNIAGSWRSVMRIVFEFVGDCEVRAGTTGDEKADDDREGGDKDDMTRQQVVGDDTIC
jgi:hypothetical protein